MELNITCVERVWCSRRRLRWVRLSAFWERGYPDLPSCGLQRGSGSGPARPIFINTDPRPSRGGRHGASSGTASSGWLARRRRDQGGVPHEVPVMQAMTTEARRAPGGRRPGQCPFFPFGAKRASAGQGIKQRLPFRCNKTKTSRAAGWRSPWSPRRRYHQSL